MADDLTLALGQEPFVDLVSFRADGSAAHAGLGQRGRRAPFVSTFGDSHRCAASAATVVAVAACDGPAPLRGGAS